MADALSYHALEAAIVRNLADPRRIVPEYDCTGWKVLDIGCGQGQTLTAPELARASECRGIDIDAEAVNIGRAAGLDVQCARAENTGLPSGYFDLVYSRVSLPYTYLHRSLPEICRLLKPGGHVWMTLHPWTLELGHLGRAIRTLNVRRLIDRLYVLTNSAQFCLTGRNFGRPWEYGRAGGASVESVQFDAPMRRALRRCGFVEVRISRGRHYLVTARKREADDASGANKNRVDPPRSEPTREESDQ